jgi:hypothetical protein
MPAKAVSDVEAYADDNPSKSDPGFLLLKFTAIYPSGVGRTTMNFDETQFPKPRMLSTVSRKCDCFLRSFFLTPVAYTDW